MDSRPKPSLRPEAFDRAVEEVVTGRHRDPFAVLGPHGGDGRVVRTFQPRARRAELVDAHGTTLAPMQRLHASGFFEGELPAGAEHYRVRLERFDGTPIEIEDAYRFASLLGDVDRYLFAEGSHRRLYDKLGARAVTSDGVDGVHFAVWAPNAYRVSVVGDFNDWDGRCHVMRRHPGIGVWDIFVPEARVGSYYKFEVLDGGGRMLPLKSDPFARYCEQPPGNASIVFRSRYQWRDADWMSRRYESFGFDRPISIYEVHLGSWRRHADGSSLGYSELADELLPYVREMGFTHIELLPVGEHPFAGSWGYQPVGLFAPTSRFGDPDAFKAFVDRCHEHGIGVIVDWVVAHFPRDPNGLAQFDGTALYEHDDERRAVHRDWDTLIFNYGRTEVVNYLVSNAMFWIEEYHVDGLRVDAVASMLYLDYSREAGDWIPNEHGGNENLEAIAFLRRLNEIVHEAGAVTIAEESTAWSGVSRPTYAGGLGFSYKWNMGWMNDTLSYMRQDPVHRPYQHDRMTFGLVYAFHENFILPLSHDEVVHGKGSLLGRMPGDEWQRFANLRAYFGFMYGHPGKKLLFMGAEIAQSGEWNHDRSLDWHLLEYPLHTGVQRLVRDLNRVYVATPALFEADFEGAGFRWLEWNDRDNSVFCWIRYARDGGSVIVVSNFTPIVRHDYVIGAPEPGPYSVVLNTDAAVYGGSGVEPAVPLTAISARYQGCAARMAVTLPPLATLVIRGAAA